MPLTDSAQKKKFGRISRGCGRSSIYKTSIQQEWRNDHQGMNHVPCNTTAMWNRRWRLSPHRHHLLCRIKLAGCYIQFIHGMYGDQLIVAHSQLVLTAIHLCLWIHGYLAFHHLLWMATCQIHPSTCSNPLNFTLRSENRLVKVVVWVNYLLYVVLWLATTS